VRYAWLGVTTQTVTPRVAAHFDFGAERGAAIQEVVDGSPAASAGLRGGEDEQEWQGVPFRPGGDVVVAVDGRPVETAEDVVRAITQRSVPGQRRSLTVVRDGERLEIVIVLGERPETPPAVGG
jgi:S1-C subfamily serine protease